MSEQRFTLVLVDDEPDSLLLFERYVNDLFPGRYHIHSFTEVATALEFVAGNHVSIIVSDLHMPGMEGSDLLVKCKAMRKGIQFYILTGDQNASSAVVSFLNGADGYFLKPITAESIATGMAQCHERLKAWGEIFERVFRDKSA